MVKVARVVARLAQRARVERRADARDAVDGVDTGGATGARVRARRGALVDLGAAVTPRPARSADAPATRLVDLNLSHIDQINEAINNE